jgi:hypothetical protein
MTIRCPCGCRIDGNDETERSRNFKEHLIKEHEQNGDSLRMLEEREELGDDVTKALLSMEIGMRAHQAPTTKTYDEILKDSVQGCGLTCVSDIPLSQEQLENYIESIICPVCGRRVGGDDDDKASKALRDHCDGHEQLKAVIMKGAFPIAP